VTTPSSKKAQAATDSAASRQTAFLTAVKAALDAGADPKQISRFVGHAIDAGPTSGSLRLLAELLTESIEQAGK
jgi:hypothetical protein